MNRRTLKPYGVAALLIALYLLDIFWLADMLAPYLGIYSSLITEILLVVISVGVFVIFHGKMKMIFPFKRPEFSKTMGTLVLWLGAYLASMTVTIMIAYFFPTEVMGASQGVQGMIDSLPTILGIFVVALSPAICEEMGIVTGICLLLISVSSFLMMMQIGLKTEDKFYKLICLGGAVTYLFQIFLTIGGGIKFIPLTGVTLPFISYGGSSLFTSILLFYLMQAVYIRYRKEGGHCLEKA